MINFIKIIFITFRAGPKNILRKIENFSIDPLTGLSNRRALEEEKSGRISLVFLDFDNFKKINDTMGYKTGDRTLIEFADILKKGSRKEDIFIRWGGDEFVIIFPNVKKEKTIEIIERIKEEAEKLSPPISFSFGAVESNGEKNLSVLIKRASEEMQKNKKERKLSKE